MEKYPFHEGKSLVGLTPGWNLNKILTKCVVMSPILAILKIPMYQPKIPFSWRTWASADFSPGEGKNFPGGQEPTFCLKNNEKDTSFSKKRLKTYYFWPALAGQGGKSPPCPPLRTPMLKDLIHIISCLFKVFPISTLIEILIFGLRVFHWLSVKPKNHKGLKLPFIITS